MISTYKHQTTIVRKCSILKIPVLHFWLEVNDMWKIFFFPLHGIVTNVLICFSVFRSSWDLTLVTFRIPTVTSWKVTVWGYQSVFKVFQGPIFFILQFLVVQNRMENCCRRLRRCSCSITSRKLVISGLHPVQPVRNYPFSKMSCIPEK